MSKFDAIKYAEWAQDAVSDYLENGMSLNDSISKIASENSLTPAQVRQVCQQANVGAYEHIFNQSEDKIDAVFDLADAKTIASSISENEKVANDNRSHSDYFLEPPRPKLNIDINAEFGVEQISNEHEVAAHVNDLEQFIENAKLACDEIRAKQHDNQMAIVDTRRSLQHEVEQAILVSDNPDRMGMIRKVAHAVGLGVEEASQEVAFSEIAKITETLVKKGVFGALAQFQAEQEGTAHIRTKIAEFSKQAEAVQSDLISDTQLTGSEGSLAKVKVVNGNHPILVSINQLVDQVSEEDRLKRGLLLLEDKASYAIRRINDLNTSALTDKYVQQETMGKQPDIKPNPDPALRRFANAG